ncbi:hypothetical protein LZL87_004289 [Fusarium oxysporum]|nr:hypothetical protein LZL87_004289 [Fusarium oxysporum]
MESQPPPTMVFFDLDNTLFHYKHSLYSSMSAVRLISLLLHDIPLKVLAEKYSEALNHVYDKYLRNEVAHEDQDAEKVKLFSRSLELEEPDSQCIEHFRGVYKTAYRKNRSAMPGSIQTLTRLLENGYRTAIITNGPTESQIEKVKAIGVFDLVECIITPQEVGHPKPDVRIFQYALEKLEGAVNVTITPILYSPSSNTSLEVLCGKIIPVISQFDQLPMALEIRPLDLSPAVSAAQTDLQQT